ncbi:hypothetical protein [Serratia sp. 506_PEND]|uniref:hypothetical protein n=1 Tax=Serratia sp. 506_PEND TaxID=1572666 RepID=UPI001EFC2470|nr:hypothetical protein [Serratia sp. 506_PEND]
MKAEPEAVFKERYESACRKKESQAQKELARLVKEYGKDGVLFYLIFFVDNIIR